jgi:hypothetical protein
MPACARLDRPDKASSTIIQTRPHSTDSIPRCAGFQILDRVPVGTENLDTNEENTEE